MEGCACQCEERLRSHIRGLNTFCGASMNHMIFRESFRYRKKNGLNDFLWSPFNLNPATVLRRMVGGHQTSLELSLWLRGMITGGDGRHL